MDLANLFAQEERTQLEKWARAHTQQCYLGGNIALGRVLGKLLMYVDTRDLSLAPHLLMNGFWEMWVTIAIARHVKPGMVCVDAGANFGYFTLLMAELVGAKGVVFACEPQKPLAALLEISCAVNGMSQVQVSESALSNIFGEEFLVDPDVEAPPLNFSNCGSVALKREYPTALTRQRVSCRQLDQCHFTERPVDFMKIDVQGHEIEVLEGAREVIAESPGIAIALEFTPGHYADPQAALGRIEALGLAIRTIGTDGSIRAVTRLEAARADTGDHRMLWLTRG